MSIYKNGKLIAGGRQCMPLLSFMWADHVLNDASWLRADTYSWQSGAVYQAAYQHLEDDIIGAVSNITVLNTGTALYETYYRYTDGDITGYYAWELNGVIIYTENQIPSVGDVAYISISPVKTFEIFEIAGIQSETIAGTTIQFYLADDGHKICPASEESNVSAIYNATGVAWYYIIDTANTRFKLPRTQFAFTGIRNGVGGFVEAGLPNITGSFSTASDKNLGTGAFSWTNNKYATNGGGSGGQWGINFSAQNSNSIYGNSNTVQPKATEMYLYFYVGNFTQTALENTAGLNAELFNGKADVSTVAHVVTEFQEPTAANNYTWYRKYADGWVEQGGVSSAISDHGTATINLPVEMSDTNYTATFGCGWNGTNDDGSWIGAYCERLPNRTVTSFQLYSRSGTQKKISWVVCGMTA